MAKFCLVSHGEIWLSGRGPAPCSESSKSRPSATSRSVPLPPQLTFTPQPAMPRPKDVSRSDSAVELLQMVHRGKRHVAHAMNVTWTHLSCYFSVLKTHTIQRKCQSPLKRAARFANCVVELLGAKL